MLTAFVFCHSDMQQAGKSLKKFIEFYKSNNIEISFEIGLAKAEYDAMFPYLVALIFEEDFMDDVDKLVSKLHIYDDEICVGKPRLYEYDNLATEIQRFKLFNGQVEEIMK